MSEPVWMETWYSATSTDEGSYDGPPEEWLEGEARNDWTFSSRSDCPGWRTDGGFDGYGVTEERARLAAAAPALVRALLAVEWAGYGSYGEYMGCAECRAGETILKHVSGCSLDAALTAAGLPDQISRDAARKIIAEKK